MDSSCTQSWEAGMTYAEQFSNLALRKDETGGPMSGILARFEFHGKIIKTMRKSLLVNLLALEGHSRPRLSSALRTFSHSIPFPLYTFPDSTPVPHSTHLLTLQISSIYTSPPSTPFLNLHLPLHYQRCPATPFLIRRNMSFEWMDLLIHWNPFRPCNP